jgi:hypothetical protein
MSDLSATTDIHEEGRREGFQILPDTIYGVGSPRRIETSDIALVVDSLNALRWKVT